MNWFTPKCPLNAEEKEWVENAFQWLIDELGIEILQNLEVILPTDDFFPDPFSGSESDIRKMVGRVCDYMDVDPTLVDLRFFTNEDGTTGLDRMPRTRGNDFCCARISSVFEVCNQACATMAFGMP